MKPALCANCRWFQPYVAAPKKGWCHFHPPMLAPDMDCELALWPMVSTDDFCASHIPADGE